MDKSDHLRDGKKQLTEILKETEDTQRVSDSSQGTGSVSDSDRLDFLECVIFASGYGVEMNQAVSPDSGKQRTAQLHTGVGSGPFQTFDAGHDLRTAIDSAMNKQNATDEARSKTKGEL